MVLWSTQILDGWPLELPSREIESASSPPGSRPMVMLRMMTLCALPTTRRPKLAEDPLAPLMVMSRLFLICTVLAGSFHCVHTSVMLA